MLVDKGGLDMEFRPCIDIHNGKVKQIVGSSLKDEGSQAEENFVSGQDAAYFAGMYRKKGIRGGHVILLNKEKSEYYDQTKEQALGALAAYPGGLQIGGGITPENAGEFLRAGADKVIVTSYVFSDGKINYDNLKKLSEAVPKEQLVLDLSCRYCNDGYYIVTDRWQKYTDAKLTPELLDFFAGYCSEFLIHAVDVEGKARGIEEPLAAMLGEWGRIPMTYAGGVHSFSDLEKVYRLGQNHLHVTVGSALDLFGGDMPFSEVLSFCSRTE
jgi:phosphoribosylformimino-5-aminoimidazole carboxamide ribotide isomerase